MTFHDVRFPPIIGEGATGGAGFATLIATTASGHEVRTRLWSQDRGRWDVSSGLRKRDDFATLFAFFRARQGRAFAFRFKDFADFELARQQIGTTNGSQAAFPIFKRYSSGGQTQDRSLTKPVAGTVRCWVNAVERMTGSGGTQFQVNVLTGVVTLGATLAATSGQAVEVSCDFDVPARFDTDELPFTLETYHRGVWRDIPVVEVRE
ncbi:MAG: DUF2460 domain-containing protein [Acetobacteraceae bacterium]